MDQTRDTPNPAKVVSSIHAALVSGVLLAGGAFFMVRARVPAPGGGQTLGMILPVLGIGLVLVAASVLRRRVPERGSQQSSDAYWAVAENREAAIVLWFVTEGAALISLVGYFLSGRPAATAAAAIALGMLILYRPSRLEGAA